MRHDDFRAALEAGDIRRVRKMWAAFFPNLPQPKPEAAEAAMHIARTAADTVSFKARAYSHAWLRERALPSRLPDKLKQPAERLYPVVVEGVGISVNARNAYFRPAMAEVRQAMETAVADAYANGDTAPAIVKPRMAEARERALKSLFGKTLKVER